MMSLIIPIKELETHPQDVTARNHPGKQDVAEMNWQRCIFFYDSEGEMLDCAQVAS